MKKIAISLLALAALSTASFADGNRGYDLRRFEILISASIRIRLNDSSTRQACRCQDDLGETTRRHYCIARTGPG